VNNVFVSGEIFSATQEGLEEEGGQLLAGEGA